MRRALPALTPLMIVVSFAPLLHVPLVASEQVVDPLATIEGLQTHVAELEELVGSTPTPVAEASNSTPEAEHSQVTIAGTALDLLPKGEPDVLEVIAVGLHARTRQGLRAVRHQEQLA